MPRFSLKTLFLAIAVVAIACWMIRSLHPFGILYAILFITACGGIAWAKQRRSPVTILGGLALLIMGGLGSDMVSNSGHAVPPDQIQRIGPGLTKMEVDALLGTPDRRRRGGQDWIYSGDTWCKVVIHYAADGRVEYVDHYH